MKVAVIGSSSMVGSRFCELAGGDFDLVNADLEGAIRVDITKKESVFEFFKKHNFEWVILFSAFTDVDGAEAQRGDKNGLCWQINTSGCLHVVQNCLKFQKKLLFISTDFIFDGDAGPYREDALYGPNLDKVSWYGISKIEGEKIIRNNLKDFLIMRISYPYRAKFAQKEDFARSILRALREKNPYPMFDDQKITPTFIDDLAGAVRLLLKQDSRGIFHLASPEVTNPYEFAKELIKVFGYDPAEIKSARLADTLLKGATPRPIEGGLVSNKLIACGFTPTNWKMGIYKFHDQMKASGELILLSSTS